MASAEKKSAAESYVIGIDDAGRGPVIGPMVLAGCLINPEMEETFSNIGIMDSKLLTRRKREKLSSVIKRKSIAYTTHTISPSEIDTGMGTGLNLNEVEALATGVIINNLVGKVRKEGKKIKVLVDCPSPNIESWKRCLLKYVKKHRDIEIICSHKADRLFPVVSAASILAKVLRDTEVDKLRKKLDIDFGSGYCHDPKTIQFLEKYVDSAEMKTQRIFRETWSTWRDAKNKKAQMKLPDY